MSNKKTGGPAFPTGEKLDNSGRIEHYMVAGATLRDYFSAKALQGMLAHMTRYQPRDRNQNWHDAISQEAYQLADAMLKERNK